MQKIKLIFEIIVTLLCQQVIAQSTTAPKRYKVIISDNRSVIVKDIKKYLDKDAIKAIIDQIGKDKYNKIIQQNNEKILPACVQNCIKNNCRFNKYREYAAYKIAEYEQDDIDAFLNTNHTRYSIIEITPEENKTVPDSCGVTSTFYVRMPNSDFVYDDSKTPLGRGDRIIFLFKNYMPNQTIINNYFSLKEKAIALTAASPNAEYCKCYTDLRKSAIEFDWVYKQLKMIVEEGEVKFRTAAITADAQKYVDFLLRDYVQDLKAIENVLAKYNCK